MLYHYFFLVGLLKSDLPHPICVYILYNCGLFQSDCLGFVHGRPQTFFPGRAKFSRGAKTYSSRKKMPKNKLFSFKKVEKHTILAGQGGGARAPSCPPLPMVLSRTSKKLILIKLNPFRIANISQEDLKTSI